MASQPEYTVQYQNYYVLGKNGGPPHIVAKPQWVKLPQNQQSLSVSLQPIMYQQPSQQVIHLQGQPTVYYRPDPAGQLSEFKSPWYNPAVGARLWDPEKPMPEADWFARGNSKPFY